MADHSRCYYLHHKGIIVLVRDFWEMDMRL